MAAYNAYTDQELFALLKQGEHAAFKEIFNRFHGVLYIHAFKRLQDREECRDLVQDLLTSLWAKREELELNSTLSGYLFMAVRNRIFDVLARKQLGRKYLDSIRDFADHDNVTTDGLIRQHQLAAIIDQEIAVLPDRTREIFELSRKGMLTHKEIAERLGISEQTVKTTVNNALKVLRLKLGTMMLLSL